MARVAGVNRTQSLNAAPPNRGNPPAPPTTLVWAQDWPATGATDAAVRGTTGASVWETWVGGVGSGCQVVTASSEGIATNCPTTNVLRVDLVYVGGGVQNMDTSAVLLSTNGWTPPDSGGSTYFRAYKRVVYPSVADPPALGTNNHCLEENAGSGNSWSWNFNTAAGGWQPSFNVWVASTATRFVLGGASPIYLDRDKWYRLEWRLHRTGADSREQEIRIYDESISSTVPEYTEADFATVGGTALAGYSAAYGTAGESGTGRWDLGTNGPNVVGATVGCAPAWYFAGVAVSTTDWCGPYTPGEAP